LLPTFAKLINNELYLIEQKMGEGNAKALHDFLVINAPRTRDQKQRGRTLTDRQIRKLVVDDFSINDKGLAAILEGART